jgi:hypothetical protein
LVASTAATRSACLRRAVASARAWSRSASSLWLRHAVVSCAVWVSCCARSVAHASACARSSSSTCCCHAARRSSASTSSTRRCATSAACAARSRSFASITLLTRSACVRAAVTPRRACMRRGVSRSTRRSTRCRTREACERVCFAVAVCKARSRKREQIVLRHRVRKCSERARAPDAPLLLAARLHLSPPAQSTSERWQGPRPSEGPT